MRNIEGKWEMRAKTTTLPTSVFAVDVVKPRRDNQEVRDIFDVFSRDWDSKFPWKGVSPTLNDEIWSVTAFNAFMLFIYVVCLAVTRL